MSSLVYWDWARLGPMSPAAQRAQLDFVRLAAEEPSSLYFEQFLRGGFGAWPTSYQRRFGGLNSWQGVSGLKHSIQRLANAPDDWRVLLASRSLSLVRLGARYQFRVCQNVLTTDLSWPTYQHAIERQAARTGNRVTIVPVRDQILDRGWTVDDVASYLAEAFVAQQCDGLFLPAVDHLGIRLPVRRIIEAIQRRCELRFVLIDAAQAFCHVPLDECLMVADFVVAGSHKWMGAYLPTGIGLFGHRRTRELIEHHVKRLRTSGRLSDPLLNFTQQIDTGDVDGHSETANLANLFACAGAVSDHQGRLARSLASASGSPLSGLSLPESLREWRPITPCPAMRSRIVLLESADSPTRHASADSLRRRWLREGWIVTAYHGGRIRVSCPPPPLERNDALTAGGVSAGA
ncbi:MAG: aminotransferase class V-fold PLP-dependent enzyme [Planctomycetaceae bacterium]|nr:aminotransferase class V-fold PLP-dependent enzyme [Planctomycetaceae bacterium]